MAGAAWSVGPTLMIQEAARIESALCFFDHDMQVAVTTRAALEVDLRRAIKVFLAHFPEAPAARSTRPMLQSAPVHAHDLQARQDGHPGCESRWSYKPNPRFTP
ncbi:MAG: hypothetical protein JNM42_02015 [Propionivibrio sp.]|uniref:hypothetical protein n=1 Tax=Propionivibrio sp. TaxID=2212460 RepID=UPI001A4A11CD|nr:hypothetical protein [Propionivibrio sp.]MBL8413193.1 hypothetical protein [Propionivibrio sp.]